MLLFLVLVFSILILSLDSRKILLTTIILQSTKIQHSLFYSLCFLLEKNIFFYFNLYQVIHSLYYLYNINSLPYIYKKKQKI